MTLPTSGNISMSQVAAELGIGLPLSLTDGRVRALAGVPSGPISMSQLRGKSAYTGMTLTPTNGYGSANSTTSGGSVGCSPSVSVSGGSGGLSYTWTVTANPSNASVSGLNTSAPSVSMNFAKQATGSTTVTLSVSVSDNTGHTVSRGGIEATLEWSGNA